MSAARRRVVRLLVESLWGVMLPTHVPGVTRTRHVVQEFVVEHEPDTLVDPLVAEIAYAALVVLANSAVR